MNHTRQDIVDAFNHLISKIEFEKITVESIAHEANIGKATFYRYFKDKYDVMNYNYKKLLDRCLQLDSCTNYRNLYQHLYLAGQSEICNVRKAFHSTGINSFENFIYSYSRDIVEGITKANRNGQGFTPTEELQIDVFCYGITYMYKKWTFEEYPLSAEEAADALYALMPESLKHYWLVD